MKNIKREDAELSESMETMNKVEESLKRNECIMTKNDFIVLLSIRPDYLIGKKVVLKNDTIVKVLDVSIGGQYIYIERPSSAKEWIMADRNFRDEIIMDSPPLADRDGPFSAKRLLEKIKELEDRIASTESDHRL